MIDKVFNNVGVLQKGLDASWLKNEVITNNIANVDTPGFKSSSVSFESAFKSALSGQSFAAKKTREKHIDFKSQSLEATVTTNTGTSNGLDGNNVDIDYENAELAKNTIYYNTLIEQVSSEFRKLSSAINNVE
jgi:flagellar basal-body rod protein FlgB